MSGFAYEKFRITPTTHYCRQVFKYLLHATWCLSFSEGTHGNQAGNAGNQKARYMFSTVCKWGFAVVAAFSLGLNLTASPVRVVTPVYL